MYTLILINYGWLIKYHNVLGKHQNNYKLVFNIILFLLYRAFQIIARRLHSFLGKH